MKSTDRERKEITKSLVEACAKVTQPNTEQLNEAKLTPKQQDRLDSLINSVFAGSDPDDDDPNQVKVALNDIKKEFGDKTAKTVEDGIRKMHFGRDHHKGSLYGDPLSQRTKGRITKSGKLNKIDSDSLKAKIKRNLGIRS
jgi:hypothetical protein